MGHAVPVSRRPFVRVEPLEPRTLFSVPNDPLYDSDGRFTNVSAPAAWDITTGSANVVVAVIDSGLDTTHPDIVPNLFVNPGETAADGVDNDGNGFIDDVNGWDFVNDDNVPDDDNGHGTHVAGIIGAAGNNGIGTTGIAQVVKLLSIKIGVASGEVFFDAAIEGLHYLAELKRLYVSSGGTQGANVVVANGSFGGLDFPYNRDFDRAIRDAADAGILFVVAAGNNSSNNDPAQDFPSKFTLSRDSVISVLATDRNDEPADFTNRGATSVNVAAPGVDIESTWPIALEADGFNTISGTSMASPMVAGIIALEAAANPKASAQQLKQALYDGVDVLDSLDGPNGLPLLVDTGGRVNAYKALRNVLNYEVKTDAGTSGNWKTNYGTEGNAIPGDVQALPLGAVYVVTDETGAAATIAIGRAGTKANALESVTSTEKVGTFYEADDFIDVRLHIVDGLTHRVSLYFTQFSGGSRTQNIEIFDPATGALLSTTSVSDFAKGKYVTFEINGEVQIRVSKVKGKSAVLNGLFVDPASLGASGFQEIDTKTSGNWRSKYDADGAVIIGRTDFPANVTGTITGSTTRIVTESTTRKGALVKEGETTKGSVGYTATETSATIDIAFNDGVGLHEVSIYAVDFDKKKRAQRIELLDASGNLLDQREITNFTTGVYVTWNVTDDVKVRFTRLQGPDAVISAIFIDEGIGESGHFVAQNTTQGGSWKGESGLDDAFIIGDRDDTFTPGQGFTLDQTGGMIRVIDASSSKKNAVIKYTSESDRIQAQLETRDEMTITLDLPDTGPAQRVSFYAADYERKRRAQRLDLFDSNGILIGSTDMVAFNNGVHATFDLHGTVTATITNLENNANRAVLSAVFYD